MIVTAGTAALVAAQSHPAPSGAKPPTRELAKDDYPKLSPYDAIRWNDDAPQIHVAGTWYDWLALDDIETTKIVEYTKKNYREWEVKRRIGEDLVEVLTKMGHPPGPTVTLKVRNLDTKEITELKDVPMTHENRQKVWHARQAEEQK
jgi:hypothetical protein